MGKEFAVHIGFMPILIQAKVANLGIECTSCLFASVLLRQPAGTLTKAAGQKTDLYRFCRSSLIKSAKLA